MQEKHKRKARSNVKGLSVYLQNLNWLLMLNHYKKENL